MKQKVKDILKEHVREHEYPINPEEIFLGALSQIKNEKKDKRRYLFGLMFFFGISIFIKLHVSTLSTDFLSYDLLANNVVDDTDVETQIIKNNNQAEQSQLNNSKELYAADQINTTSINTTQANTAQANTAQTDATQTRIAQASVAQASVAQANPSSSQPLKNKALKNTSIDISPNTSIETEVSISNTVKFRQSKQQFVHEEKQNGWFGEEENLDVLIGSKHLRKANKEVKSNSSEAGTVAQNERIDDFETLALIPWSNFEINQRVIPEENLFGFFQSTNFIQRHVPKFALSLTTSYGLFKEDLVANDQAYLNYATMKSAREKELEVLSSKLLLNYMMTDQLSISVGAKFQQINEEFTWVGSYFVNEIGEVIDVSQDNLVGVNFYQEVNQEIVDYNKHQVLSIPLLLGLQKNIRRFSIGVKAGPIFQVYSSSVGHNLGIAALPVTLDMLNPQFGMGWEGNLEFAYVVGKLTTFFTELSAQNLHTQEQFVSSNINSLSIGLGVKRGL